jgi:hypothetical protein
MEEDIMESGFKVIEKVRDIRYGLKEINMLMNVNMMKEFQLKNEHGLKKVDMKVNGSKVIGRERVFSLGLMETNMKDSFFIIKGMAMEC